MTQLQSVKIIPILGRKTNCPADSSAMFQALDNYGRVLATHDAGGINWDLLRNRRSCSKSYGYKAYTSAANSEATKCLGLFELYDGTNRNYIMFDNGKVFVVNQADLTLTDITPVGVTFANNDYELYSIISFGGYMVFSDFGETTPYKWTHGDTYCTKLIQSGTEYKFRYLEEFHGRIIGAYSDQTNGDLEIRWTDALPNWGTLDFPAANQLYKPVGDDGISGLRRLGTDTCILYADNSIHRIEYYPTEPPFTIVRSVANYGAFNDASIVSAKGSHFLFCADYGFCRYDGGADFPAGGTPISQDIETEILGMSRDGMRQIVGTFLPVYNEICWAIPLDASSLNSHIVFYNPDTGQWRFENKALRYIDTWLAGNMMTWAEFSADLGGTLAWNELDPATATWGSLAPQAKSLMYANEDGYVYTRATEAVDGGEIDGYRVEPVFDFNDPLRKDLLLEIWMDIATSNDINISVWWRGGDTLGEVLVEGWQLLGTVSCNNICAYLPVYQTARLHQIKWGTTGANEPFDVSGITLKTIPQGIY